MDNKNNKNQLEEKLNWLGRLLIIIVPLFLFLLIFNKVSSNLIFAIIIIALGYALFRRYLWVLLALSAPSLIFGKIINISITTGWIYEARLAEIFLALVAIIFFLDIFLNKKLIKLKFDKISFLLFIYLIFSLAMVTRVIDARLYVFGMKIVVFSFLAYFLALNLFNSRKKIQWFLGGLIFTAVILGGEIFFKFYQMGFSSDFFFARNTILFPIAPLATVAAILAFLSLLILGFSLDKNFSKIWRLIAGLSFIISAVAVFFTLGRAAILSFAIGLSFIFIKSKKRIVFVLIVFWLAIFSYIFFAPFFSSLWERWQAVMVDVNTKFRITEYKIGWEMISEHPWLGVGPGQQLFYFQKKLNLETGQLVNNFFLQAWMDLGIVGFFIALLLVKNIYKKTKKILLKNKNEFLILGLAAALICAFLNGLAEVTIYALPYAIIFWLVIGAFKETVLIKS